MRKCQALRIARMANISQAEFLDRFLISDFLLVILCVVKNLNIRTAIPRSA
jgi:hypothetical protein